MTYYGLLGKGITYSLSPKIHKVVYEHYKLNCDYRLVDGDLEEKIDELKALEGFNVTIPYKQDIIPYLEDMDNASKKIGAVNTVVKRDGKWFGYNTDYHGFKDTVLSILKEIPERAIILGTGGSALAVYHVLKDIGVTTVNVVSRNPDTVFEAEKCLTYEMIENSGLQSGLLVNCTPVGRDGKSPVSDEFIARQGSVIDLIYNPEMTPLLKKAADLGKPCANGLMMLIVQALYADQLWFPQIEVDIQALYHKIKSKVD